MVPFLSKVIQINDGFSLIGVFLKTISLFDGLQKIISDASFNLAFNFMSDKRRNFFGNTVEDITSLVQIRKLEKVEPITNSRSLKQ